MLNNKQHGTSICRKEWAFHMEHQSLCFKDMTMSGDTKFKLVWSTCWTTRPHGSESAWQYNVNSITLSSSVVSRSYFQRVSSSFFGFRPPISTLLCFHFAMWSNNSVLYYSRCIGATYMQPRISQSVSKNVCVLVTGTRGCCTMSSAPNQNNPLLWDASPVALCHLYWWCLCFAFIVKDILPLAWSNKNIKMKVYLQLLLGKRRQRQRGFL